MPQFNRKFANSKPLGVDLPLTAAVGAQIHSQPHDAALVQALLKQVLRPGGLDPFYRGRIDGQVGMQTINAITAYQEAEGAQMSLDRPGFFAPNGNGIKALAAKAPKQIVVMEGTLRYQYRVMASSFSTPSPCEYKAPMRYWATGSPASANGNSSVNAASKSPRS